MTVDQLRYKTSDEVDFVIIGSGAAGGILAKELSTNGFRVVVLEQGPYLTEADFTHNEIEVLALDKLTNHPSFSPTLFGKLRTKKPSRNARWFMGDASAAQACISRRISGGFMKLISSSEARWDRLRAPT